MLSMIGYVWDVHRKVMPLSRDGETLQTTSSRLGSALNFLVALMVDASEDEQDEDKGTTTKKLQLLITEQSVSIWITSAMALPIARED